MDQDRFAGCLHRGVRYYFPSEYQRLNMLINFFCNVSSFMFIDDFGFSSILISFLAILEFELRALCLLGRH
jgi:hypothetical protein